MEIADTLVVTATLGNRKSLKRTVESVKSIGAARVKHVLVAPPGACEGLAKEYPDLTIIPEPEDIKKGIYPALNYGLRSYAKDYKYLTYINDDDFWLPGFKSLFKAMDRYDPDIVYGRVYHYNPEGKMIKEQPSSPDYKSFGNLLHKNIILFTQQATLTKSKTYLKLGGFDENLKLVADTKFWLEAINAQATFKYVNEICAGYTTHDGQLSADKKLQAEEHEQLVLINNLSHPLQILADAAFFRLRNAGIYFKRYLKKLTR